MRKSYISPEFLYKSANGTLNSYEESTFFGSKMLDIEDYLTIDNNDIVWYQSLNGEQLNFSIESTLEPLIYYTSMDKKNNHKLYLDNSQTQ